MQPTVFRCNLNLFNGWSKKVLRDKVSRALQQTVQSYSSDSKSTPKNERSGPQIL